MNKGTTRWFGSLLVLFLIAMFTMPRSAEACSCAGGLRQLNPPERAADADTVFAGQVVSVHQLWISSNVRAVVAVDRAWKGITTKYVTVTTGVGGGDCGYPLKRGRRATFYGTRLSICDPPGPYSESEFAALGSGTTRLTDNIFLRLSPAPDELMVIVVFVMIGALSIMVVQRRTRRLRARPKQRI